MKKYILSIIAFTFYFAVNAQVQLWGMTSSGGRKQNGGTIFNIDVSGNNHHLEYEFPNFDFAFPSSNKLVNATDGMLYGVTVCGGACNEGVLFQYDPATNHYTAKYSFESSTGISPYFLMQAKDGRSMA